MSSVIDNITYLAYVPFESIFVVLAMLSWSPCWYFNLIVHDNSELISVVFDSTYKIVLKYYKTMSSYKKYVIKKYV